MRIVTLIGSFLLGMALLAPASVFGQAERDLSLETDFPLTTGDTFMNEYDGVVGANLMYSEPVTDRLIIRVGLQYNRLDLGQAVDSENTFINRTGTANDFTPRVGVAYWLDLGNRLELIPEAGFSVTRLVFDFDEEPAIGDTVRSGGGFWLGLNPRYELTGPWKIGASMEYRFTHLESTDVRDTAFDQEYHALNFGASLTYTL